MKNTERDHDWLNYLNFIIVAIEVGIITVFLACAMAILFFFAVPAYGQTIQTNGDCHRPIAGLSHDGRPISLARQIS